MIRTELIRPIHELLGAHARDRSQKLAFRDDALSVDYGALFERTGRLGGHLGGLGVDTGDRTAILMGNRVEAVESYLGIARAASVGVCVNASASDGEICYMLEDSDSRVALVDEANAARLRSMRAQLPALKQIVVAGQPNSDELTYDDLVGSDPPAPARDELTLDDPAWMLYTSGTTGRPKGVLLSQRSCLWVVAACWAPIVGLSPDDTVLSPLPLFHSYALDLPVLGVVAVGASERILPRFSTDRVLELLREEPITLFPGVPTMFHYLVEGARERGFEAPRLRMCVSAGAIMPASLNEAFQELAGVPLLDGYGITETSTMVTMSWPSGARPMGSCGLPLVGSTVRIVEPDTNDEVEPGADGELLVRGPHVMLGYHNRPEDTEEALHDGWYHTGDLGQRDEDGYITITGRIKELIIRGGENVYPAEVEELLVLHDEVLDCAVVGMAHDTLGEVPVAFVVPHEGGLLDATKLEAHCRQGLSDYKVPTAFRKVESIPRTGSGKIVRYKLQEQLDTASR